MKTMTPILFQLTSILLISILTFLLLKQFRKTKHVGKTTRKLPPGPWKFPLIGNLHKLGASAHHSLHQLSLNHGPLMLLHLGTVPTLVISSGDIAGEIFKTHDILFSGRPALYASKLFSYGLKDIALAPYGEYWRQARRISVLELLSAKRVKSFRAVREEEVQLLVEALAGASPAPVNLSEMLLSVTNNIVCRILFGKKYRAAYGGKLCNVLEETQSILGGFCISDYFPWMEWVHRFTGLEKRLERNFRELDEFYDEMIQEHLEDGHEDLLDVLLRLWRDPVHAKTIATMSHIKGLLTDFFTAGTDTSSATLIWTMTELMRNPRVMLKAQEEVRKVIGNNDKVEEHHLDKLDYLKLVIKESLRMHPPAPLLLPRETTQACTIKGYVIPEKTRVLINAKAIAMDPKSWENPEDFFPERFLEKNVDFRGQDFDFIPFGVGRRSCPGINFATAVIELVLSNLLFHFDWTLPIGMNVEDLDLEEAIGITVHKKRHLQLAATLHQIKEV
ncbi:hypothetical protein J5N97_020753 [Dioscorea zingiberensis]|uniref:Cytochrome P450 n=1 Tax=Dioscorea zingiberensis TaxID=325984 RepID=A0A9D5CH71_9LILI|nr:hypothetical protein J5N97_020753 [Dioscorea zingiberensis]